MALTILFLTTPIHSLVLFATRTFRNSMRDGDEIFWFMTKIPSDGILESLYKLRIRESAELKTVLELYDMEIHQKISVPNYQKLKNHGEEELDHNVRLRNFDARHERIETGAVVKNRKGLSGVQGGKGKCYGWKEKGCVRSKGDQGSFQHESNDRAKPTPKAAPPSESPTQRGRSASRKHQRQKPVWEVQSTAVQTLLERYLQ